MFLSSDLGKENVTPFEFKSRGPPSPKYPFLKSNSWHSEMPMSNNKSNRYTVYALERNFATLNVPQIIEPEETQKPKLEPFLLDIPELMQLELNLYSLPGQPNAQITIHDENQLDEFLTRTFEAAKKVEKVLHSNFKTEQKQILLRKYMLHDKENSESLILATRYFVDVIQRLRDILIQQKNKYLDMTLSQWRMIFPEDSEEKAIKTLLGVYDQADGVHPPRKRALQVLTYHIDQFDQIKVPLPVGLLFPQPDPSSKIIQSALSSPIYSSTLSSTPPKQAPSPVPSNIQTATIQQNFQAGIRGFESSPTTGRHLASSSRT